MQPGELIDDQYRLIRELGEGGFGAVWLADEVVTGRRVAIKFLHEALEREDQVRFRREVEALARLSHEHVLTLFRTGELNGAPYLVTEYIDGEPLRDWQRVARPMEQIVRVGAQIASALDAAHREGVVHRDLKPPNVMVLRTRDGLPSARVLDFGIARLTGAEQTNITETGDVIGTPGYMSPEQLLGRTDIGPATDLYNLGVLLWEMIERRSMFTADTPLGVCMQHLTNKPPPLTQPVPPHVGALVFQLLDKDPGRRGSAANALMVLQGRTPRLRAAAPATEPEKSFLTVAVVVALTAFALLGAVAVVVVQGSSSPDPRPVMRTAHVSNEPSPPRTAAPRLVAPDVAAPDPAPSGCGLTWDAGLWHASSALVHERSRTSLPRSDDQSLFVVPESYDPSREHAVIVVMHDGGQTPSELLAEIRRLVEVAAAENVLLVLPEGERVRNLRGVLGGNPRTNIAMSAYPWKDAAISNVFALVALAEEAFCVDSTRLFLVGHGQGSRAAEEVLSRSDVFAAVAMTDYRRKGRDIDGRNDGDDFLLTGRAPIPYLWVTAKHSRKRPDDGKPNDCLVDFELVPFDVQERDMREHNQCRGQAKRVPAKGGTCETWDCDVPFVSCRVNGGRHWPDYPGKHDACNGNRTTFDYGGEIWKFFESVSEEP